MMDLNAKYKQNASTNGNLWYTISPQRMDVCFIPAPICLTTVKIQTHASDTSSEHHMNQLRPAVGAGTGGGVNAQVLIQWIWSGARVFAFSSGPQLIVMSLVEG